MPPRHRYTGWRKTDGSILARELYDHTSDPGGSTNIASEEPALAKDLAARLAERWPEGK